MVRSPSASAAELTAADLIIEAMQRFGDRVAFVLGDQRVSYSQATETISRIVRLLTARGVGPGRAIAALSPNMPEVWLVQAAAYLLGTTYAGLHPMGSLADHAHVCQDAGIAVLVVHPKFAETGAALAGGWLHTRDLAVRDEEGFFYLVDRKKDVIVSGAFNVYPREIEDVISRCTGVSAVAVIGVPDARWGEAVTAFVAARPGEHVDQDEIRKTVREQKGAHQTPKTIHVVDELPKTAAGKIDRRALRRPYWGEGTRQIHLGSCRRQG